MARYERDDATRSIEIAKRIADVLEVSLDYLVGSSTEQEVDKVTLNGLMEINRLSEENKKNGVRLSGFVHHQNQTAERTLKNKTAMKEVTLKIPEEKLGFFMELIKQLGIEVSTEAEIPEEHKAIVRERMKRSNENPDRLLDWEQVQDDFKFD